MTKEELLKLNPEAKIFTLKQFQDDFIFSTKRFPAFVSAWGTGKTMSLITRALNASKEHRNNRGLILRREWVDLRDSTIKDWMDLTKMKLNGDRNAVFQNGSEIMFRHGEELTGRNLQNMNLGFFIIEQAEEFESDEVFQKLRGRLRLCHGCGNPEVNGQKQCNCKQWGGVIANTNGHNWIYNLWKASQQENFSLSEAATFDNIENLPKSFTDDLRRLEFEKPKVYRRFVMNSWDDTDAVDLVIDPEWVRWSKGKVIYMDHPIRRVVSIDVARYGDDKTIFYAIENGKCIGKEVHEKKSTMEIVGRAILFAGKHSIKAYAVDEIGVGSGVVDRLRELQHEVVAVNSSETSSDPDKFYNTRAEIYGYGSEQFQNNQVSILQDDGELAEQLSWAKYKVIKSNGQIQIEAKEEIKKRYGRSPDEADAFLNGLWALKKVRPIKNPLTSHDEHQAWKNGVYIPEWAKGQEPMEVLR